jgi:hypothetical protein
VNLTSASGWAQADAVSSAAMLDAAASSSLAAQGFPRGGESAMMAQPEWEWGDGDCTSHSKGSVPDIPIVVLLAGQVSKSVAKLGCLTIGLILKRRLSSMHVVVRPGKEPE